MFPNFDTISGKPNGLDQLRLGYTSFKTLPSVLNDNFNEGLATDEIESIALYNAMMNDSFIAAEELGGGKKKLSELELDTDFLGNRMLTKSLGYLSDEDSVELSDFAGGTAGTTKDNYMKVMRGDTMSVLKSLKDKEKADWDDMSLQSYFVPVTDPETGELTLKQVVGTKEAMAKIELAGASLIHSYGPKKFSENPLISFTKGVTAGFMDTLPAIEGIAAGTGDLAEGIGNLIGGKGFTAEYDESNALADYRSYYFDQDAWWNNKTTQSAQDSIFANSASFSAALGNGIASLVQAATTGRAIFGATGWMSSLGKTGQAAETLGSFGKFVNSALQKSPELLAQMGAGMIMNYNEAYQAAREAGLSLEDAAAVGFATGALNTAIEMKLGSNALMRWLATGKSGKAAAQAIVKETGGDMSKLFNRQISNNIVNNVLNSVDRFTSRTGFIGNAFEEGLEEFLQAEAKNSIESLYDRFVAPEDAQIGMGKFGTKVFDKKSFKSALEEGAIGAIVGALGGVVHSRSKEAESIAPYIAAGEFDALDAGLNMALKKGAINENQHAQIKTRIDGLRKLREVNSTLFAKVATASPERQIELSTRLLEQLDAQEAYANDSKLGVNDNYESFVKLLNNASIEGIDTTEQFASTLKAAGKNEEAYIIETSKKDAQGKVNRIAGKPKKFNNDIERIAWEQTKKEIENTLYQINANRLLNSKRRKTTNAQVNSLLADNEDLQSVKASLDASDFSIVFNEKLDSIRNAKTEEETQKAVKEANDFAKARLSKVLENNLTATSIVDFAKALFTQASHTITETMLQKQSELLVKSDSAFKDLYDKTLKQYSIFEKIEAELKRQAEAEKQLQKTIDYFTGKDYQNEIEALISSTEDEAVKERLTKAKNGDTEAQLETEKARLAEEVAKLNKIPTKETAARSLQKERVDLFKGRVSYLEDKKSQEDKDRADSIYNPVKLDFSNLKSEIATDKSGNEFYIDQNETQRSVKLGNAYTLIDKKTKAKSVVKGDELDNYTVNTNDGKTITLRELSDLQIPLTKDKSTTTVAKEGLDTDYEPVTAKSKPLSDPSKNPEYAGERLAADEKFSKIINTPGTDVSAWESEVVLNEGIEDVKGYEKQKEALKTFKKLLKASDPSDAFNELDEDEKEFLYRWLPIQINVVNKGFKNKLFAFNNSDITDNRKRLLNELLKNKGKLSIPKGHLKRTPGYVNYISGRSVNLQEGLKLKLNSDGDYVYSNGEKLVIGVADSTNAIHYNDPKGEENYLLTAKAQGNPGSIYLVIPSKFQLTGEEGYVAKLNPTKIPQEIANVIADIFAKISTNKIKLTDAIAQDNEFGITLENPGYLTYADFLNQLIFFGDSTVNDKIPNKTLFIDWEGYAKVKYGVNSTKSKAATQNVLSPTKPESVSAFAKWITNNKNFSISRKALIGESRVKYGFTLTSGDTKITFKTGESYLTAIVRNGFVKTDLDITQGLIGKSYLILQNIPQSKPTVTTTDSVPATTTTESKEKKGTSSKPKKINLEESTDGLLDFLNNIPEGTSIKPGKNDIVYDSDYRQALIKKGKHLVNKAGEKIVDLAELKNDEEAAKIVRRALISEYNKHVEKINTKNKENATDPENVLTVRKYPTTKGKREDPNYEKKLVKLTISYPKTESKPTTSQPKTPSNTTTNSINPFEGATSPEELKLQSDFVKLLNHVFSTKNIKLRESGFKSLLKRPRDIKIGGNVAISAEDLTTLLNHELPNGITVGSYINGLIKNTEAPILPDIEPINKPEPEVKEEISSNDEMPPAIPLTEELANDEESTPSVKEMLDLVGANPLVERKKVGSGKFGGKKKTPPAAPMEVFENAEMAEDLKKEIRIYRAMLGKMTGGNIKFVNKLIDIIGRSGRPSWAWSIMTEDGVTLTEKPARGAIYHEAFHRISLLVLTPDEQRVLYGLARKEYSLYGKTDNEIEEFLAERFREYVLDNETPIRNKVSQKLYDLWQFIKNFLRLNKNKKKIENIEGFFNAIRKGEYKFSKINKAALSEFNLRYATGQIPLKVNGVTLQEIYDSSMLTNLVNTLTAMVIDFSGIQNIEDITKGLSYTSVKNHIKDLRDKFNSGANNESFGEFERASYRHLVDLYDEILTNFQTVFVPLIDAKLQGFNIRKVEQKLEDRDDLNDLVNDEIRSAYEFSAKENAQADIRVMFLTIKESEDFDSETFLPKYVNPEIAWYNTFSVVHTANSIEEMIERLRKKGEETNTIRQANGISLNNNMYFEVATILEEGDELFKTRFWNTFKKHRNKFINAYFASDRNEKGKKEKSYNIHFGDADLNKRSTRLERNWSSLFGITGKFKDKSLLKQVVDDFEQLKKDSKTDKFKRKSFGENASRLLKILNSIDINVDSNTLGVLLNQHFYDTDPNVSLRRLLNGEVEKNKTDKVALNQLFGEKGILQKLIKGKIDKVEEKALNLLESEKSVREFAKAYVAANPTAEDDSVIGPDGSLVYAYSENNTITSMFEDWLKDEAFYSQVSGVTYNQSSFWLGQMKDEDIRNNIGVETMLSLIGTDEYDTGRGYLDIAPVEDLLLKFNAVLNNKFPLPTLANKRTFYFVTGLHTQDVTVQDGKIDKSTVDVFVNYAINEYTTIQEANKAKERFLKRVKLTEEAWNNLSADEQDEVLKQNNTNYKELVENYHYITKGGAMRLGGNGYKFRYFSSLQKYANDSKFFSIDNSELRNAVQKYLIQQVNNTIKFFINKRIISGDEKYLDEINIKEKNSKGVNGKIIHSNILLPSELGANKSEMINAIAKYAINTAISTIEFEKIVSGDVAFYKGSKDYQAMLDDRVKRYSALTSTKSILREEFPEEMLDFDTHKYRVSVFSTNIVKSQTMYEEMKNKYIGTDEEHGVLWKQYEKFREEGVNGFNLTDEELKQKVIDDTEARLGGYLGVDQTDAQVLISPKMFRKLSIMNGEWTDEKETAYELLQSDDELTVEKELQAYSVVMQPLKYIHFGYDFINGLQVPIYDKMSLATVFKQVAKGRDLQKVYDFMADNDVDMIKFETAVKSGLRQKGRFYKDGEINEDLNSTPVYEQSFKYLGKQLVTDPHHVSRIALGTQMAKIGVAGVESDGIYEFNGKSYTGQQLLDDYVTIIGQLSDLGRTRLMEDFGITTIEENGKSFITLDRDKFTEMLKTDAMSSNLPSNLIDVLRVVDNENGTKDYYVELSGLPALSWIQSRIISMIKKETIDVNTPGGSMIQMSNFAFKDSLVEVDIKNYNYKTNKELRFRNEDNRMEAVISINLFKDVLPHDYLMEQVEKNNSSYFDEARKFILANKDLAALSYRIPTQGMNSTLAIDIVDVLPANVGDTIILPAELTKLTGADFD